MGQEPVAGLDPPRLPPNRTWTTVEFTDLRFDYSYTAAQQAAEEEKWQAASPLAAGSTS